MTKRVVVIVIYCFSIIYTCFAQQISDSATFHTFYYPNGEKSSEGWMVAGKPEGLWRSYDQQGRLMSEGSRKNHLLDGAWYFFTTSGDTSLIINYVEGKKWGKRVEFLPDEYIVEWWEADTLRSPVNSYYRSGKLKVTTPYVEGKPHGFEKSYDTLGHITSISHYYRGVLTRRERINRTDDFGFKQGAWKFFWENGNLQMEGTYLNDKKHGFFKRYDEAGNFLMVEKYEHDILIEDAPETKRLDRKVAYHPNGTPAIIATYYKGKADGLRREFDTLGNVIKGYLFEEGYLRFEGITDMNGQRQGWWKEYYPTGELKSEGKYKNSMRVGVWKHYFTDKTIEVIGAYNARGKKEGEWKGYYANRQLMYIENYEAGVLHGDYVAYDDSGEVLTQGRYDEGSEEGYWFYRNVQSIEEGHYETGLRSGKWKIWYEPHKLMAEMEYQEDLLHGNYTIYYENSVIKCSGKYEHGERHGLWRDYLNTGELILTTLYKEGKEVSWNGYKVND